MGKNKTKCLDLSQFSHFEEVEIGGHKLLREPTTGTLIFDFPDVRAYLSPDFQLLKIEPKRGHSINKINCVPQSRIKASSVIDELQRYKQYGFEDIDPIEGPIATQGIAMTYFIKVWLNQEEGHKLFYDTQTALWQPALETIMRSFEIFRRDCFSEVKPCRDPSVSLESQEVVAEKLYKNLESILLKPREKVDVTGPLYFFHVLNHNLTDNTITYPQNPISFSYTKPSSFLHTSPSLTSDYTAEKSTADKK